MRAAVLVSQLLAPITDQLPAALGALLSVFFALLVALLVAEFVVPPASAHSDPWGWQLRAAVAAALATALVLAPWPTARLLVAGAAVVRFGRDHARALLERDAYVRVAGLMGLMMWSVVVLLALL
ncbi:hypothetical protein GGR56DRAFT_674376 [Xylariaceae sp. FL0804]|nr:hypothetical protein GGR56DRAFT_674376 [Xylariaceae sp. FL0804]